MCIMACAPWHIHITCLQYIFIFVTCRKNSGTSHVFSCSCQEASYIIKCTICIAACTMLGYIFNHKINMYSVAKMTAVDNR